MNCPTTIQGELLDTQTCKEFATFLNQLAGPSPEIGTVGLFEYRHWKGRYVVVAKDPERFSVSPHQIVATIERK